MFTVGMYLSRLLDAYGIEVVFGIPGVHTVELYRGLEETGLRHVTPRHEQGAGFMADGYARATGRPAACYIITGPGMTNIVTAMGQAYADSVPMLVISAVNAFGSMGSGEGWLHELKDQRQLVQGVCEFSHTITDPAEINPVVARAFSVFSSARPRPVHIELPLNIITASAEGLPPVKPAALPVRPDAGAAQIEQARQWIDEAKAPVILLGGGAQDSGDLARALAEAIDAPAVMTVNGRGLLPNGHPLAVPCNPSIASVRTLIEGSDLVIAVGTEFGQTEYDVFSAGMAAFTGRSIRIDIDPQQMMRTRFVGLPIVADAAKALAQLVPAIRRRDRDGARRASLARDHVQDGLGDRYRIMRDMMDTIRDTLPGAVIVGDSTQPTYAGCIEYAAPAPRSWFCSVTGYGTLGYGLPAAIGAQIGKKDAPVVCITGDGGFQFSLQELATARENDVPVVVIIWNNRGYAEIKSYMISNEIATVGVDLFTPDFQMLARAFDCDAVRLRSPGELREQLRAAATRRKPTVIEIDEADYFASET